MKTLYIVLFIAFLSQISAFGQKFTVDGINYEVTSISQATVEVSKHTSFSGSASIPETVTNESITYSVTSIGEYAFDQCTGLTSVNISNSVKSIEARAFSGCSGLTSISIPNSVKEMGNLAFSSCTGLTSISIPNSVSEMGNGTFAGCHRLTTVSIPNSVSSIGAGVFADCTGLSSVNIPNSITSIGPNAFASCEGLTSIDIPNSVKSIGESAFYKCTGLTTISIPNSITYIDVFAFYGCLGLNSVTVDWASPLDISYSIFDDVKISDVILYVPKGTEDAYRAAPVWKEFNIQTITSVDEFESNDKELSLFPNPVSHEFTISSTNEFESYFRYSILDLNGKIVSEGITKYNEAINIERLAKGSYIVQIDSENGKKLSKKLVKD